MSSNSNRANRKITKIPTTLDHKYLDNNDHQSKIDTMYNTFKRINKKTYTDFDISMNYETEKTKELETIYAVFVDDESN
jgi:hypothetical protein